MFESQSETVRLVFVRVGPTTWDVQQRIVGGADVPLAPGGEPDVQGIPAAGPEGVRLVLCSDDDAGRTYAGFVAAKLPLLTDGEPVPVKPVEELAEVGLGLWEGMLATDAEQRYATAYGQWKLDPASIVPPDGESLPDAQARILHGIGKGLGRSKSGGTVVVVLRPLAWTAAICALENRPSSEFWAVRDGPGIRMIEAARSRLKKPRRQASRSSA